MTTVNLKPTTTQEETITTYNVHLYREMMLSFCGIEAGSQEEAALKARALPTEDANGIDDCAGRTFAALVDIDGDEDHALSCLITFERSQANDAALLLLDLIRYGLLSLENGDAYFETTLTKYAFDDNSPDWQSLVKAIGWDQAREALKHARTA
jgi:hypothetical protein